MARAKKKTKAEKDAIRAQKRREEYAKLKADPILYEKHKEKERERYKKRKEEKKILPAAEMSARQKRIQRKRWRIHFNTFYKKQKEKKALLNIENLTENNTASNIMLPSTSTAQPINNSFCESSSTTVLNDKDDSFCPSSPGNSSTSTASSLASISLERRRRYRSTKIINHLQKTIHHLQRVNNMYRKRIFRMERRNKTMTEKDSDDELNELVKGIPDSAKKRIIKKELISSKSLKKGLKYSYSGLSYKRKQVLKSTLEPIQSCLRTKRMKNILGPLTRKSASISNKSQNYLKEAIVSFFLEDENSQISPNKKEFITRKGVRMQKRFLCDTLKNLHEKFNSLGDKPISYSFFCKQRPFWVMVMPENARDTCACKLHTNVDLLLKSLKKKGIIVENSTSEFIKKICCNPSGVNCLKRQCADCANKTLFFEEFDNSQPMEYMQWVNKKKDFISNGVQKTIRVVEKSKFKCKPKEVIEILEKLIEPFLEHVSNIRNQFQFIQNLKEELKEYEVILHVDFSENYVTKYNTEIQSFHFGGSRSQISIHTVVLYFRDENILKSQSICTISECLRHDAAAVWAHLGPVMDYINENLPNINTIHVLSDSPSSQYRNKSIFYIISKLSWDLPHLKTVTWNYNEVGHGKGAPDGLGATLKRTADRAVRYGRDVATFEDFFHIVKSQTTNIRLYKIDESQILQNELLIPRNLVSFKGTMQVHQAVWDSTTRNVIALRKLSCNSNQLCKYTAIKCHHGYHIGFYTVDNNPKEINTDEQTRFQDKENIIISGKANEIVLRQRAPHQLREFARDISDIDNISLPSGMLEDLDISIEPIHLSDIFQNSLEEDVNIIDTHTVSKPSVTNKYQNTLRKDLNQSATDQIDPRKGSSHENININVGDWIVIELLASELYISQVISVGINNVNVQILKKIAGTDLFLKPFFLNEKLISKTQIKQILSEPKANKKGHMKFNIDVSNID